MAHVKEVEVEPPMHLQRPSSGRSQDVSHLLASVFREVFTRDVIGEGTVKNLSISKSGDAGYHDKYVEQLRKIQEERDHRHREADMLEAHIMQAQAAATAADERELQRISEGYENYHVLGLPPGAGSVLETLQAGRPLIVVINELLMDNHQLELASQLAEDGHLYYATCSTLQETIKEKDLSQLKPFPPGKPELFSAFIDKAMGFHS